MTEDRETLGDIIMHGALTIGEADQKARAFLDQYRAKVLDEVREYCSSCACQGCHERREGGETDG